MATENWVVAISHAPGRPDSEEMLELVLAGASLEADILVIFRGAGVAHVVGEAARPWRQLTDLGLASIWYESDCLGARTPAIDGAREASRDEISRISDRARGVLVL